MARIVSDEENEISGPKANARCGKAIKHIERRRGGGTTDIGNECEDSEKKINAAKRDQSDRFGVGISLNLTRHRVESKMSLHAEVKRDLSENAEESD